MRRGGELPPTVGDMVWVDGRERAAVLSAEGGSFKVRFADGREDDVPSGSALKRPLEPESAAAVSAETRFGPCTYFHMPTDRSMCGFCRVAKLGHKELCEFEMHQDAAVRIRLSWMQDVARRVSCRG